MYRQQDETTMPGTATTVEGERLGIRVLGVTAVVPASGVPAPVSGVKPRQILGMLAVNVGVPMAKDQLAEWLWDGRPPRAYLPTLESYVCVLRRQLGAGGRRGALATASRGYLLDPDLVEVDHHEVGVLLRTASDASPAETVARVGDALRRANGALLASEPYAPWAVDERRRFEALLAATATAGAQSASALGDHDTALTFADRALEVDPLAEDAWTARLRSLAATGRRLEALRCFGEMRTAYEAELGLPPGPEAQALHAALLAPTRGPQVPGQRTPGAVTLPRQSRRPGPAAGASQRAGEEVRALLDLLRTALEAVPGLEVPAEDHRLSAVAARLVGAA